MFNFSIVLSFAVAIFAIFSTATVGVVSIQENGVSYAAPIGTTGESFTFNFGKYEIVVPESTTASPLKSTLSFPTFKYLKLIL